MCYDFNKKKNSIWGQYIMLLNLSIDRVTETIYGLNLEKEILITKDKKKYKLFRNFETLEFPLALATEI